MNRGFLGSDRDTASDVPKNWTREAAEMVAHLPRNDRLVLRGHVERYATPDRSGDITPEAIFRSKPKIDMMYPIVGDFAYEKHRGPIYGVACSPFHRNLFLSASADGNLRMHSMLLKRPIMDTTPAEDSSCYLYDVAWSPNRPTVFGVSTSGGELCIFDVSASAGMNKPVASIAAGGERGAAVFSLAFNPKTRGLVATASADGMVRVHKLSWSLSNELSRDDVVLGEIAKIGLDDVTTVGEEDNPEGKAAS